MQNKLSQNLSTQNNTHFLPYNHLDMILQGALPEGLSQDDNQGVRWESHLKVWLVKGLIPSSVVVVRV